MTSSLPPHSSSSSSSLSSLRSSTPPPSSSSSSSSSTPRATDDAAAAAAIMLAALSQPAPSTPPRPITATPAISLLPPPAPSRKRKADTGAMRKKPERGPMRMITLPPSMLNKGSQQHTVRIFVCGAGLAEIWVSALDLALACWEGKSRASNALTKKISNPDDHRPMQDIGGMVLTPLATLRLSAFIDFTESRSTNDTNRLKYAKLSLALKFIAVASEPSPLAPPRVTRILFGLKGLDRDHVYTLVPIENSDEFAMYASAGPCKKLRYVKKPAKDLMEKRPLLLLPPSSPQPSQPALPATVLTA